MHSSQVTRQIRNIHINLPLTCDPASGATQTRSGEHEHAISCAATPSINVALVYGSAHAVACNDDRRTAGFTVIHNYTMFIFFLIVMLNDFTYNICVET